MTRIFFRGVFSGIDVYPFLFVVLVGFVPQPNLQKKINLSTNQLIQSNQPINQTPNHPITESSKSPCANLELMSCITSINSMRFVLA
jgi:hypothetical protein